MAKVREENRALRRIAVAFELLADAATSGGPDMELGAFSHACAHVSVLFGSYGIAFKFAEKDYVSKVNDLIEASKSISTVKNMIDLDIQQDCVRQGGSHTRNLLRVKRGIDMLRVLFQEFMKSDNSLRDAVSEAYEKVFAAHHGWAIRKAVAAGMYTLPSKSQILKRLNEDEETAKIDMQSFIRTSESVIQYVEELFISRKLGIDW